MSETKPIPVEKRELGLKEAAAELGYKSAAALRLWIVKEKAPGKQNRDGKWIVEINQLREWAIANGKKVVTLPFREAKSASNEPAHDEMLINFGGSGGTERLIQHAEQQLSAIMAKLAINTKEEMLDSGAIQRLTTSIKSLSNELRQLKDRLREEQIEAGKLIEREVVELTIRTMAESWRNAIDRCVGELIERTVEAIDAAEFQELDRSQRARIIGLRVEEQFTRLRAQIATDLTTHCPSQSEPEKADAA